MAVFVVGLSAVAACGPPTLPEPAVEPAALTGRQPVATVHLLESPASALVLWRQAGLRGRTLLYLAEAIDLVPAPDPLLARIASSAPEALASLEAPVPGAGSINRVEGLDRRSALHVAARLGMIDELIWVVPDGALDPPYAAGRLPRLLPVRFPGLPVADVRSFHVDGATIRGEVWGIPVTICELGQLPAVARPILLAVDLPFLFRVRPSGSRQADVPWISPGELLERLARAGVRTDFATVSLSGLGRSVPEGLLWVGGSLAEGIRDPSKVDRILERERLDALFLRLARGPARLDGVGAAPPAAAEPHSGLVAADLAPGR